MANSPSTDTDDSYDFRCGYISIIGRPNVGKSTLLNHILGQKISITSRKPQTTRIHLIGIKTEKSFQAIYIDTPGIQTTYNNAINRQMLGEAMMTLEQVNVLVFMIEVGRWTKDDSHVLKLLQNVSSPIILVINKIDRLGSKDDLLPFIKEVHDLTSISEIIPISAKDTDNVDSLEKTVYSMLPSGPAMFAEDQVTNRTERFFAAEFIREKLIQKLGDELPYQIAVTIDEYNDATDLISIKGLIWVESKSQKLIVVGKEGSVLKSVGEQARKDMEKLFQKKVYLRNWVTVSKNWTKKDELLQSLKDMSC